MAFYVILIKNIPSKTVDVAGIEKYCKIVLTEISIKTHNWSCISHYKSPSQNGNYFLDNLSLVINGITCQNENFMLTDDFNMTTENENLEIFMNSFGLECSS